MSALCTNKSALRIGIDGRNLQGQPRGDGRYVLELCRQLDRCFPQSLFFVYSSIPVDLPVASDRWRLRSDCRLFSFVPPLLWLKIRGWMFCRQDQLDIFWGTNTFLPLLPRKVRKVITVHDLCFQLTPETFTKTHLMANRLFFLRDIRRADVVVTNSQGTAGRVFPILGYRPSVVPPGVAPQFQPQAQERIQECFKRYDISGPYLLNVAAWEPRKNLESLVGAFLKIKREGLLPHHRLVLVGKKFCKYERLQSMVESDSGENIHSLGYVADSDLPPLYAGADVFVFPSYYEGYGMPVIEARACGTTVVTSNIPELREAGGADAIYVEPTEEGIAEGILTAVGNARTEVDPSILPTWEKSAGLLALAMLGAINRD